MLEVGMKVRVKDGSGHEGYVRGLRKEGRHVLVDGYDDGHDGDGLPLEERHTREDCQWVSGEVVEVME